MIGITSHVQVMNMIGHPRGVVHEIEFRQDGPIRYLVMLIAMQQRVWVPVEHVKLVQYGDQLQLPVRSTP